MASFSFTSKKLLITLKYASTILNMLSEVYTLSYTFLSFKEELELWEL